MSATTPANTNVAKSMNYVDTCLSQEVVSVQRTGSDRRSGQAFGKAKVHFRVKRTFYSDVEKTRRVYERLVEFDVLVTVRLSASPRGPVWVGGAPQVENNFETKPIMASASMF